MNIAIFGLGYVGCTSVACLARDGHRIVGVDINPAKVEALRLGRSPLIEPGLHKLIESGVAAGLIEATDDAAYAMERSELAMICVGTPSHQSGSLELRYVERVCRDIGQALVDKQTYAVIVLRSTVLPGTAQERLIPLLETESHKKAGTDFGFCINPEFLREGSAIADFDCPPYTIIGQLDEQSGERVAQLYVGLDAPLYRVPLGVAEAIKYASNAFHALKVAFANELGNICQAYGVDSHQVMDIFVQDTKLNLSRYYLKPGFAFGGSCLGKDLRALLQAARQLNVRVPLLGSILPSNELQIQKAADMLLREGKHRVGVVGLSFKPYTDDLRESPTIELVEQLIGKGFEFRIYDREVSLSQLHGSNRAYIDTVIPHIGTLMRASLEEVLDASEVIVVTKRLSSDELDQLSSLIRSDHILIDLVRLDEPNLQEFEGQYRGICW